MDKVNKRNSRAVLMLNKYKYRSYIEGKHMFFVVILWQSYNVIVSFIL
jgi:hypothetical protein